MRSRPAIFFDRDGTLNEEVGYAGTPERFHLFPFAAEAVRRVNAAGWAAVIVTNQAGIARGLYSEADLAALHQILRARLAAAGAAVDGIYYCPHHPDFGEKRRCDCRKPNPGLLLAAARELGLDLSASVMIGDSYRDIGAAVRAGAQGVLVRTGYGAAEERALLAGAHSGPTPAFVADDVLAAVKQILEQGVPPRAAAVPTLPGELEP